MTMPLLVVAVEVGCKVKLGCARGEVNGQLGGEALEGELGEVVLITLTCGGIPRGGVTGQGG